MSTRAVIAYKVHSEDNKTCFKGIYSHWDGYPNGLGNKMWEILQEKFINNKGVSGVMNNGSLRNAIKAFCNVYIDGHPSGWSIFNEECYCHSPEFVLRDGLQNGSFNENSDFSMIEYIYIFDIEKCHLYVYSQFDKEFKKDRLIADIDIEKDKPDWDKINEK